LKKEQFGSGSIKAVLFDLDGVLLNSIPAHVRAWQKVFAAKGLRLPRLDIVLREGVDYQKTARDWMRRAGLPISQESLRALLTERNAIFQEGKRGIRFFPGALPLLKDLRRKGYHLALVTGTPRFLVRKILGRRFLRLFSVVVTPEEVKRGKPFPDPYLRAVKRLGLPKRNCLVVENAPYGVRSAKRAGVFCVGLTTSVPRRFLKGADDIVSSLAVLRRRL